MAPLALVFFVRERPAGYALGGALAAGYVVGEVLGAGFLIGPRLSAAGARGQLVGGLAGGAVAFMSLGLLHHAHPWILAALAAMAGAAPSAAPGGLRALLVAQLPEDLVVKALSVESVLTYVVWAVAPALTAVLTFRVAAPAPLMVAAAAMACAAVGVFSIPQGPPSAPAKSTVAPQRLRVLARAWPVYLTSAAANALLAVAELVLPALLEQREIDVQWTGPLLAGFSIASAVGATVYGLRVRWPGSLVAQTFWWQIAVAGCIGMVALTTSVILIAGTLVLAGLLAAGVYVARMMLLRQAIPSDAHAAAYSMMYAAGAGGYSSSAAFTSTIQHVAAPSVAILYGTALTVLLTIASTLGQRRGPARLPGTQASTSSGDTKLRPEIRDRN
ncbi:MFS transporter [Mycobacterium sp. NPDC003449]